MGLTRICWRFVGLMVFVGLLVIVGPERGAGQTPVQKEGGDRLYRGMMSLEADTKRDYVLLPSPDAWYNRVDGFKAGLRITGQVPGTFDGGPHRLRSTVWLGTSFPRHPVGYQLEFTEPVARFSEYGSEAAWSFISGIGSGYYQHGVRVKKRWQPGFDETVYRELQVRTIVAKRFNLDYVVFEQRWSGKQTLQTDVRWTDRGDNKFGRSWMAFRAAGQWLGTIFLKVEADLRQEVKLGKDYSLSGRLFAGVITRDAYPEHLYLRSSGPASDLLTSRITEARGTIPPAWIRNGTVHISGASIGMGPSLRGAVSQEMRRLREGDLDVLMQSVMTWNLEFSFSNPVQSLVEETGYLNEFFNVSTYLFADAGGSLRMYGDDEPGWMAGAGAGTQVKLSFPGPGLKTQSFVLRFDVPFWLSDDPENSALAFRPVVGLGAVIPF